MTAYVFEKDRLTEKKNAYGDGFHVMYPYICTKPSVQLVIRSDVMEKLTEHDVFKDYPLLETETMETIVDKGVIYDVGWLLYGSKKSIASPKYTLTHIYHKTYLGISDMLIPGDDIKPLTRYLVKNLNIRQYTSENDITPLATNIDPVKIDRMVTTMYPKPTKTNKVTKVQTNSVGAKFVSTKNAELNDADKKLLPLLDCLAPFRCDQYNMWYRIGAIIYNEKGSFILFDKFSQKCPNKYDLKGCQKTWNSYREYPKRKAVRSKLIQYAKQDNAKEYKKLDGSEISMLLGELYQIGGATDNNIAKLFKHQYPDQFIYDPLATFGQNRKCGTWLTYDKYGKYHICDGMEDAKRILSCEIFQMVQEDFNNRVSNAEDEDAMKYLNKQGASLLAKLKNTGSKYQIIEQLKEFYDKGKIFEKLDEINPYLIGFDNGVYDLQKKIFRNALPNELMYITTGYNYQEAEQEYIDKINAIIESIYPDKAERDYIMTVLSFGLVGIMHLQEFYMLIGNGGNGKKIIMLLIMLTLGPVYCTTINIECFKNKGKISSNEKSQQFAGCKQARFVFVNECDFKKDEEFESGTVKSMSGGDQQNCKLLYKEQTRFYPKYNLYFITNDQIPISIRDRICPHRVTFVEKQEYDEKNKYHRLAIGDLDEKLTTTPEYKYAFFHVMLTYYFRFLDNDKKLAIPQTLIDENINFSKLNDPIGNFISDCLIITNKQADKLQLSVIMPLLHDYDNATANESLKSLGQYLDKRNLKITKIKGYLTCTGIKFNDRDILINKLKPKLINKLIDLKLVTGPKLEDDLNIDDDL